jgi:hypothetical protein
LKSIDLCSASDLETTYSFVAVDLEAIDFETTDS